MAKSDMLRLNGEVVETLPNAMFRVVLESDHKIIAYIGGKIRKHEINIATGDKVEVEMSPYDMSRGRIVYRTR